VSEAFSNVAVQYLVSVPLAMATIGWVAATATARLRTVTLARRNGDPMGTPARRTGEGDRSRTRGQVLLRVAVAVAGIGAVTLFLLAR